MNWTKHIRETVNNTDLPESGDLSMEEAVALKEFGSDDVYELIVVAYTYGYIRGRKTE